MFICGDFTDELLLTVPFPVDTFPPINGPLLSTVTVFFNFAPCCIDCNRAFLPSPELLPFLAEPPPPVNKLIIKKT